MSRKSLLTREMEIELAGRVEQGERTILEALVKSPAALRELAALGAELHAKTIRVRDLLRDAGDEELADEETSARLMAVLDRAAKLVRGREHGREHSSPTAESVRALLADLDRVRLHRRILERVIEAVREDASSGGAKRAKTIQAIEEGRRMADAAKKELIESNLRLVVLFARRHMNQGLQLIDLVQEGNIGLMRAVDKFDHRRGVRFSTYASWWVKQQIVRAIADQGKTIRVPVHMVETRRKVVRARRRFAQEHGREPDTQELVEQTGLLPEKVQAVSDLAAEPISLEAPSGADGEATVADFVRDRSTPAADEQFASTRMRAQTRALLKVLSPREQEVLRLRFGLEGAAEHTLQEIGAQLSLSRERVRQIEVEALRKLRAPSVRGELESYIAA